MSRFTQNVRCAAVIPVTVRDSIEREAEHACASRFGTSLRAAVLTGSLARDEATGACNTGSWTLSSDADFFLVFRDRSPLPADTEIEVAGKEAAARLSAEGISIKIGFAGVSESFLRSMPRHIATYELKHCGRVICGDQRVLELVPAFEARELVREDAWRLLANRIVEVLEAIEAAGGDPDDSEVRYRTVKLYLDMATSYLVFTGQFAPSYRERERRLQQAARVTGSSGLDLELLADNVSACTAAKLGAAEIPKPPSTLWRDSVQLAHDLWRWELRQLTGEEGHQSDTELMRVWMHQQPLFVKVRGWASARRRSGRRLPTSEWLRWARQLRAASPRYLVYVAATAIFFQLPELVDEPAALCRSWRDVVARLPLTQSDPACNVDGWQGAARVVSRNYRQFLETTTA
jgi:hypothetical protein